MANTVPHWVKNFARLGYASRAVIYGVIGIFAAYAAIGIGETMSTEDAVGTLLSSSFGALIALVLIVGLVSYAGWRFTQSGFDTDDHGAGPKGLAVRFGLAASGTTYSLLALYTWSIWTNAGNASGSDGGFASFFEGFIGNQIIAWILAIVFSGVAGAHIYKAYKEKYADHLTADQGKMKIIHPVSKVGLTARGIVFLIVAFLLAYRGLSAGGSSGRPGLEQALDFIHGLPAGDWLLAAMGVGLLMFAAYSMTEAVYRQINIEDA